METAKLCTIHIERDQDEAKFWLEPIRLQSNRGFSRTEINAFRNLLKNTKSNGWQVGMTSLVIELLEIPKIQKVTITDDTLSADLSDGRTISVPLAWYPRLLNASVEERSDIKFG